MTQHTGASAEKIDASVGECSPEDIKNELQQKQPYLRIRELIKFKTNTHVFKIECESVSMAGRALQEGLKCFYPLIPRYKMQREKIINLHMCFNCYTYEEHNTVDCPQKGEVYSHKKVKYIL